MSDIEAPSLPAFNFTTHPSALQFAVPRRTYISNHPGERFKYKFIATGALVFDVSTPERILLIQRAAHDSMPNEWETPGGGCDDEDPSVLHGVARELWEEVGLHATNIGPRVGEDNYFLSKSGKLVCKFSFLVDVEKDEAASGKLDVKLDPNEHQNYVWATEEEVKAKRAGDVELKFTTKEQEAVVLDAFKVRRALIANGEK